MIPVWSVDFETMPIGPRPDHYPPEPVGVSIRHLNGTSRYYAWGHRSGDNNCTKEDADRALREVWDSGEPVVFHHAKFDLAVAYKHFHLPALPWQLVHDTMFLAFLMSPYEKKLGLKELGVVWLGMSPDEQDVVKDWILAHKEQLPRFDFIRDGKPPTKTNAGAWIAFAPVSIVGPYAIGDTDRTWKLFQVLYPLVVDVGMTEAYDRERQVMPIFMENERVGLRVDLERLERETALYTQSLTYVEDWLRWKLGAPGLNLDADADVGEYLDRRGIVTEWVLTKTGKRSVAKDNLHPDMFNDPEVAQALGYRNRLKTCLKMFMEPWLKQAQARQGWISTEWNQVASDAGGTRTGRPSTRNPNFLNISKSFLGKKDGYSHPDFLNVPALPLVRRYILADEGCVVIKRDFSGQELRVFAHFEQGDLLAQYQVNPKLDVHHYVGEKIAKITNQPHWIEKDSRTDLKAMNFQGLYGGGVPALSKALRITTAKAKEFKKFHNEALPGRKILSDALSVILRQGRAVKTWGGRLYIREPMKLMNGRWRDFDYRMLNYLVQGSAADITKQAMIDLHNHPDFDGRFMLQVYDELNTSVLLDRAEAQMQVMQDVMEGIDLRVQMLTDGSTGYNWAELADVETTIAAALATFGDEL